MGSLTDAGSDIETETGVVGGSELVGLVVVGTVLGEELAHAEHATDSAARANTARAALCQESDIATSLQL